MKSTATAKLRHLRMAPRKVRLLIDLIRGMHADEAELQLQFSKKWAAKPVLKLLRSAKANAQHNANIDPKTLVVKTATVDEGPTLYRWQPRAFGRATPLRKRSSHITIVLEGDVTEIKKKATKAKKVEKLQKSDKKEQTQEKKTKNQPAPKAAADKGKTTKKKSDK